MSDQTRSTTPAAPPGSKQDPPAAPRDQTSLSEVENAPNDGIGNPREDRVVLIEDDESGGTESADTEITFSPDDVKSPIIQEKKFDPVEAKAKGARLIGLLLVITFAVCIIAITIGGIGAMMRMADPTAASAKGLVTEALVPLLQTVGAIFGSLLAFVLGYFFKEAGPQKDKPD